MAKEWRTMHFKGIISSDRTKKFLVDLAKTGVCENVRLNVIDDDNWDLPEGKRPKTIFDDDSNNGIDVSVWLNCKKREKEKDVRLADNPTVKKFVEEYVLYKES